MHGVLDSNLKDFEMYVSVLIQIDKEEKNFLKHMPANVAVSSLAAIRIAVEKKISSEKDAELMKVKQNILEKLLKNYNEELRARIKKLF